MDDDWRIYQPGGVFDGLGALRLGGAYGGGGIQFESTPILPVLPTTRHPIIISKGEGSIVIPPIVSYRRPTGGKSFGLGNRLTAKELAPKPTANSAL